ncbi:hypothetical protein C8F04DRAFT_1271775 [Mycena alexandri]|uniref:F-box domain-containing protein n=1 Tax=Mycena alexandri TaxID=1745969 RepID=A0AAD6S9D1_9AGAR|nr:hypothetical protein C8F04DRAFT_1271775 [Mycena alexandri]
MLPQLPQELIDAIVEEVPEASLPACSLATTPFVMSSQRRLFRRMTLSLPAYECTAHLLAASPHLALYVRLLVLDVEGIPPDCEPLRTILAPLTELERLSVLGGKVGHEFELNPYLGDLLSIPSLKFLELDGLTVPSSLITRAFFSCEEVLLSNLRISDDGPSSLGNVWHISVSSDMYNNVLSFVLDTKRGGSLPRLRRLSLTLPVNHFLRPMRAALLVSCSPTLEHLKMHWSVFSLVPPMLPFLPLLKVLELWLDVTIIKSLPVLYSVISAVIASTPHLEVLTLSLMDTRPYDKLAAANRQQWPESQPSVWAKIDSAFADPHWLDLREVCFCLRAYGEEPKRFSGFIAFMQANLPRTCNAGMTRFSRVRP